MDSTTRSKIELLINSKPIFVFMKGNKLMPQCGFSNNVVQILNSLGMSFDTFDVLSDMEIREGIKEYSNWPTIPQVYVKGEFIGGSDILIEMYNSGEEFLLGSHGGVIPRMILLALRSQIFRLRV